VNLITSKILDNRCRLATEKLQHGTGLEPVQSNFKCITLIGSLPVGKAIVPTVVINKQSSRFVYEIDINYLPGSVRCGIRFLLYADLCAGYSIIIELYFSLNNQ
jgi:hypothetical protein